MKISGASIMGRALIVCSVCLFFATAVKADVCFLPADLCYEGAANVVSQDCSDFTETSPKGEGWTCVACGDKYKCEERQCPAGYTTSSTCGSGLSATCDGGKSGNKDCCKCEDSAQKCINEGYGFVKTGNNSCSSQDKCPYNSSYYKICTCTGYDEISNGDQCNNYATCDLGDADHENYYKITGSRRQCNNSAYVTADSPQYTSGENDCTLACTESCDNNKKYYTCTAKITCNPSEGKYSTKELCEASLQQFSWVDWLYQTVQNINLIRTSYAGVTTPNQDLEPCHYCRDAPNYNECMRNCMGLAQPDDPVGPLCPVDQDRLCVSCTNGCVRGSGYANYPCCSKVTDEPITACIGMMMEMDMSCVHCKTDDPSWRAPGCEGYPCCIETPCIDDCTVLEAPYCTRSGGTWVKTGLKSKCGNDCLECQQPQATESPCELKDGCWVVKNGGCDEASGLYASEGACTNMGWPCSKTGNCWRRTKAELTLARISSACNPILIVRGTETTVTITPNTTNHVFVDAGINTLSYALSTGIPSSFTVSGPSGSTVMTAKQTGTEGAIGSYTFVAGKSYQITPDCSADCSGCDYCISGTCTNSGDKRIVSNSSTYEACPSACGNGPKFRCRSGYTPQYVGSNQYMCVSSNGQARIYYNAPTNCNYSFTLTNTSTGATLLVGSATQTIPSGTYRVRPSTSAVQSFTIRMGSGGTPTSFSPSGGNYTFSAGNDYWLVPSCSNGGGGGNGGADACPSGFPNRYTNIPITGNQCTDVCCADGAQQPLSYSYMTGCTPRGSYYTCQYTGQTNFILCYRSVSGMLYETEAAGQSMESGRFCQPGWIRVPNYTRCTGSYLVGCSG